MSIISYWSEDIIFHESIFVTAFSMDANFMLYNPLLPLRFFFQN